jgi:hypothetical protein
VVAETEEGRFLVKLRGAAQGTAALVASGDRARSRRLPDPAAGRRANADRLERRRRAYHAFLWKRLKPPRPFLPALAANGPQTS